MKHHPAFRPRAMALFVAMYCASAWPAMAGDQRVLETKAVEVISTTPLPGIGLPIEQVPASVQVVKGEAMQKQGSLSIADYMNINLQGVSVNDTQNNPFQPDVSFRGYAASPLLGTPQGLSVYIDGVRVNEPFGDVVSWDLIPMNAISSMSMIPGSNPLFGLNTLGGAISLQTKSGRTHQGGAIEASAGSWDRGNAQFEYGGVAGNGLDYFISGNYFDENGWRDYSPTEVKQVFGKVGWQNETTKIDLSYTGADNDMIGNGLIQADLMRSLGREAIHTRPDQTENQLSFLNLTGAHWFNDATMFSGNLYYRNARTRTLNGDINDDFDETVFAGVICDPADLAATCSGALNRSSTRKDGYGFNGQFSFNQDLAGHKNQFIAGLGYDYSRIKFKQNTEFGILNASRSVDGVGEFVELDESVNLKGTNRTWSVFATDTFSFTDQWHLTLSGRYNHTEVENDDQLDGIAYPAGDPQSLTADHSFNRINPAVGLNFTPTRDLTVYGSYNEGSRAPTSMELGCANPDEPCKMPNAMAGDPPLKQVVAKTWEAGLRGNLNQDVKWSVAAYRATNHDDILFQTSPGTTNGMGYFANVGKTRRIGLDTSLIGAWGNFSWAAGYSYVRATYESSFFIANEVNSSAEDFDGDGADEIRVKKGDQLAGIPQHQLKLRGAYQITPDLEFGVNIVAFSDQYARGNENNAHDGPGGKVGGYTVVNLDTRYQFGGSGWQAFAKANNVFDREYNTGGMLGETLLNTDGSFAGAASEMHFYSPGAPRAGWVGLRYEFGR